ncbi:phosphoglycerate kinase [Hymenobacter lutimineralis]|uniref:Phosphoglycerate kinase n=1 Tax=Hymenobacter lutimineralis TaxID=2606448 RepID=A0A5D6V6M1_9BACT|nr:MULTISPECIES: phosphoglycerate kinase [Hymenobacter]QIX62895.1 phosphoglycerate kinase [Hymenobacter sp. BT18]TYZ10960.1 phosphoglycerate kinase [Hymenobacter lutimineralis]
MKTLDQYNFAGKRAVVRVDFNVPLDKSFAITDDTRIRAATPTIKKILQDGGSVVLLSHLGRPKGGPEDKYSLKHLVARLGEEYGQEVQFATDALDAEAQAQALQPGQILLVENVRFYAEEEKGNAEFAAKLAKLGDVYVNDAFGAAHRKHASTAVIAENFAPEDRVGGYLLQGELDNAKKVLEEAERPFTAIMGGAKISDKILIIEKLLDKVDNLLIGGGMAYTFAKAQGGSIGNSLLEADKMDLALELIEKAKAKGVNLVLPTDSLIADKFANDAETKVTPNSQIPDGWMGLDLGPDSIQAFSDIVRQSKTILWNGPMGVFEMSNFAKGTESVAQAIADATQQGAFSLIGGGDSAAAVNQLGFSEQVSYISTGGGALLEYMEGKELPGVTALG